MDKDKSKLKSAETQNIASLRRRAEERLREKTAEPPPTITEVESLRLLHELQVHQIELEMQNAELGQAREEIDTLLEKYTDLYDFAPVGYVTLDRNGTINAANITVATLLGTERSRLVGRKLSHFVVETRFLFADFLEKVFASQAKEACEVALLKEVDAPLFVQIEGLAVSRDECRLALIDITERKRAAEVLSLAKEAADSLRLAKETAEALRLAKEAADALRLAKEAAEAIARTRSLFLVNMSHELRTPMTGILGMLQLALDEDLAPVPREYLETTLRSARSLLRILNDILDMAKVEVGKLAIEEKPFSLPSCVNEAVDFITPEARRKGLDFDISVAEEMPATVVGDQTRLRQVLTNLIGNAVKFTEEGKVVVRVTAGRSYSDGKREYTFAVTDTGIGIPDDKKELLFRPFSQIDASHSRRYGGTGLGLVISREIVKLMGGTISFESAEGVGSTFSFTIPLGEAGSGSDLLSKTDTLSSGAIPPAREGEKMPHLLLAEDDPTNRKVLELMLNRSNFNLDCAVDGQEAIEMWEKGGYDLVLMDIQMPRLDGLETTRAIREKERERGGHTPIVALTAHVRKEDEETCLAAGMDAFVTKPIDFKRCVEVIRGLLDK